MQDECADVLTQVSGGPFLFLVYIYIWYIRHITPRTPLKLSIGCGRSFAFGLSFSSLFVQGDCADVLTQVSGGFFGHFDHETLSNLISNQSGFRTKAMYANIYVYMCVCVCVYICMCIYIYIYTYVYIMYIHIERERERERGRGIVICLH